MRILVAGVILVLVVSGLIVFSRKQKAGDSQIPQVKRDSATPTEKPTQEPEKVDINASFEIYTHGTKRIFTASMYHNLSPDVYITSDNPSIVHVKKAGITWTDFFATLPMQLTKDCLVTGTKQTFCSGPSGTLDFYINGQETPDALDEIINSGDSLRVTYGP